VVRFPNCECPDQSFSFFYCNNFSFLLNPITFVDAFVFSAGIKTYAWWPVFNDAVLALANPTNALHTRFDFGSTNLVTSSQFVSPHSNAVRQHQLDMISEILSHPQMMGWDGVRLDYIRFNYDEDDFSQPARDRYEEKYGVDPMDAVTSKFDQPWKNFRRDEITSFLQEVTTQCHSYDANLDVGGYMLPFPAHPDGFDIFQGQGNDFTQYNPFNFRVLPMIYYQDWAMSSLNFESWTKEKMFYSVQYTLDTPAVWPTFSITTTGWCENDESCNRDHVVDSLLIAANSGKDVTDYGPRTVEMFHYNEWGKVEWDRLSYALSKANDIISTGTAAPASSPDPNDCTHFVPCGYVFYQGKDSPGNDLYTSDWRNIPQITIDCDADPGCEGFNSNGYTKSVILAPTNWDDWGDGDPCLGLYVKEDSINVPVPTSASPTDIPTTSPSRSPTILPTMNPTNAPTSLPTEAPSPTDPNPTSIPTKNPTYPPTSPPTLSPTNPPSSHLTNSCPYPVPNGYVFHPFKDSPGYGWCPSNCANWRDIPAITNDCDADSGCIGFNSNGWLKWHLKPESDWDTWTDDPCLGFYVKE